MLFVGTTGDTVENITKRFILPVILISPAYSIIIQLRIYNDLEEKFQFDSVVVDNPSSGDIIDHVAYLGANDTSIADNFPDLVMALDYLQFMQTLSARGQIDFLTTYTKLNSKTDICEEKNFC